MALSLLAIASGNVLAKDQLPSWNDGPAKTAIVEFVTAVTGKKGPDYVESAERARGWNQARVNKSGEISEHFRESCVKSGKYSYPVTLDCWKKSFNAAYTSIHLINFVVLS